MLKFSTSVAGGAMDSKPQNAALWASGYSHKHMAARRLDAPNEQPPGWVSGALDMEQHPAFSTKPDCQRGPA